jgi:hypothetical protein
MPRLFPNHGTNIATLASIARDVGRAMQRAILEPSPTLYRAATAGSDLRDACREFLRNLLGMWTGPHAAIFRAVNPSATFNRHDR